MKQMRNSTLCIAMLMAMVSGSVHAKSLCKQADGSLVNTFGDHGLVTTDMGTGSDEVHGIVVLPCGKIVAAGTGSSDGLSVDFALARYTPFGALDMTFGVDGKVFTDLGTVLSGVGEPILSVPSLDVVRAAVLQKKCNGCTDLRPAHCDLSCNNDCNIVVVGNSNATASGQVGVAVARYTCDGTLDTTFGTKGTGVMVVPLGILAAGNAVAIQEDNKIVIVGQVLLGGSSFFLVLRLNCDGTLDETFGCDHSGMVLIGFGGGTNDSAQAVKIQKDGKIVVAGFSNARGSTDFALVRLTKQGLLDTHFGPDHTGKVLTDFSGNNTSEDLASALVLTEACSTCFDCKNDPKIVVVGNTNAPEAPAHVALAGYTGDGHLDRSFGSDHTGLVVVAANSKASAAVLQKDCTGKCTIVVGGTDGVSPDTLFALRRYTLRGVLDPLFGVAGVVHTSFGGDSQLFALTSQENGNLVAGGFVRFVLNKDFALASYNICNTCCVEVCAAGCAKECGNGIGKR